MPTLRDVVKLARDEGHISVHSLTEILGLPEDKACRAIKACWDRGLLLPMDKSFFALPGEDGSVPKFVRSHKTDQFLGRIFYFFKRHPERALTVNQAVEEFESTPTKVRNAFEALEKQGSLISAYASAGGWGKNHPKIWGVDQNAIASRNLEIINETAKKKKKRKAGTVLVESEDVVELDPYPTWAKQTIPGQIVPLEREP